MKFNVGDIVVTDSGTSGKVVDVDQDVFTVRHDDAEWIHSTDDGFVLGFKYEKPELRITGKKLAKNESKEITITIRIDKSWED